MTTVVVIPNDQVNVVGPIAQDTTVAPVTTTGLASLNLVTQVFNVKTDYGAKGNGTTDDTTAVQAAITAAGTGGRVYFPPGIYQLTASLTTPDFVTLEGGSFFLGSGGSTQTQLRWSGISGSTVGITAGTNITLRNLLLRGPGPTGNTCTGITPTGIVRCWGVQFYSWNTAVALTNSFYSQFYGCEWSNCHVGVKTTGCYNLHFYGPTFRPVDIALLASDAIKQCSITGGSIEGFSVSGGINLAAGSSLCVTGTYWESPVVGNNAFGINCLGNDCTVTLVGNTVYLTEINRWVNMSGLDNCTLFARGNTFHCDAGSSITPKAYFPPTNSTSGTTDCADDDWTAVLLAAATYITQINNSAVQNLYVRPPRQLSDYMGQHEFLGRAPVAPLLTAAPTSPIKGATYWADQATWNPVGEATARPYAVTYDGTAYRAVGSPGIKQAASPSSGTWRQGDVVWNSGAAAGGIPGWVCVTAGTPGTWKAMAVLAS